MKAPIFITGYWNSGTTLLVDILRKHPEVRLRRARYKPNLEERTIVKILRKLGEDFIHLDPDYTNILQNGFSQYHQPFQTEQNRIAFRKIFDRKFRVPEDKVLLLKNPWLFFMPDFLDQTFADIRPGKIIILRDGPGQVVSKDYWKRNTENPEHQLLARAKFWVKAMEYYFAHWYQREDTLTLSYDHLCNNPAMVIQQICEFSGIPFDPLAPTLPGHYHNRRTNWKNLDEELQEKVLSIVSPMQERIGAMFNG